MTPLVRRLCLALSALFLIAAPVRAAERAPVILISIDGFRADYAMRGLTPTLAALATEGAWAPQGMRPSFPVNTFPNHYTLVTGLRPDHHGITDNTMFDTGRPGVKFSMGARDQVEDRFWWDGGEPVWVTAERAGMKTATMFWPGSEAAVRGVRPTTWFPYQESLSAFDRVDRLLGWLDLPQAERPRFMTLYFEAVDTQGHRFGPDSPELNKALADVDAALARLVAGLKARGVYDQVNLVVVADHGLAQTSPERVVFLDDVAPADSFTVITAGWTTSLIPKTPEAAKALVGRHKHFRCWRKGSMPRRLNYGTHPRIPPIICLSEIGWVVTTRARNADRPMTRIGGSHGADPFDPAMRALFVARGPDIRAGVRLKVFDNVSVYPFVMALLGLTPQPNDGDPKATAPALK
ncbi:MAG: ectonucleotide pyrophosphatase/phosphodiesterase [Caulobacter sp.]|nr:ectonucleotide pyrophosphatase/phosphodiesterase [Caulobacter sp.]